MKNLALILALVTITSITTCSEKPLKTSQEIIRENPELVMLAQQLHTSNDEAIYESPEKTSPKSFRTNLYYRKKNSKKK